MPRYEGILVTWNSHLNTSAAGAVIEKDTIKLNIYHPSDSIRNLQKHLEFTFSLTDDPSLFYKSALTGSNELGYQEVSKVNMENQAGFYYPRDATVIYCCKVENIDEYKTQDRYGKSVVSKVEGIVMEKIGDGKFIQRENPLVDAMVYATRVPLVDGEQKEMLKEKIYKTLENQECEIAKNVLDYIEGY
ncbi:MAG: DUF447 domain-containing protein [Thermoplasmatota archaeon]